MVTTLVAALPRPERSLVLATHHSPLIWTLAGGRRILLTEHDEYATANLHCLAH